ncbi:histone-lysine N-methyltransferase SETMAR [Protopterus annectens]|uniref:histone-lysine N-methyltransferase SETMAR n=1 Tax=Protopterus annectens TaxID=7888 RepID=UPI001CF99960|nr:histone-lysine N-methyltransferase SETMAR [Protopterus annectens]
MEKFERSSQVPGTDTALCLDICCGLENIPVPVESGDLNIPVFKYTPHHIAGPGAEVDPDEITFTGCECLSPSCTEDTCRCFAFHGCAYESNQCFKNHNEVMNVFSPPIFECNIMCKCSENCINRVVQRGLQFKLQVFKTASKGWGLRTLQPINKGLFVCEYAGEILGFAEACRRTQLQTKTDNNYLIAVREYTSNGQVLQTYVDPAQVGNIGRFINHSCQPNLFMVPVRVDSMVPKLGLFAASDIMAGEELSYDYSGKINNLSQRAGQDQFNTEDVPNKPCHCGAPSCVGFLPYDRSCFES